MLFNTPEFAVFFVVVMALYYALRHRMQNLMLLVASYVFYGWWDWRFLGLLAASTVVDFLCALWIDRTRSTGLARIPLAISIAFNMGVLCTFKYFNFFSDSFHEALLALGWSSPPVILDVVLPVGISFYTFQTMSYTIDVYRGSLKPTRNVFDYALFLSFFPQLVAGPIERASHLLPAITSPRTASDRGRIEGSWLIFWGLFKKVVVADNLARIVDPAFADPASLNLASAALAIYAFAWQIYCDFSGYTDIARGCASWMGIDLCINFDLPYFATSPSDFWSRWHISLSTWLRDYIYIPLGGNRGSTLATYRNLMVTMLLGGLWHGASWNFVLWGLYHGLLLVAFRRGGKQEASRRGVFDVRFAVSAILFFQLTCIGWLLFRAESLADIVAFGSAAARIPESLPAGAWRIVLVVPVLAMQFGQFFAKDSLAIFRLWWPFRALIYIAMYLSLIAIGNWGSNEFVYFQF